MATLDIHILSTQLLQLAAAVFAIRLVSPLNGFMCCYMNMPQLAISTYQAGQLQSDGIEHMACLLVPIVKYIGTHQTTHSAN